MQVLSVAVVVVLGVALVAGLDIRAPLNLTNAGDLSYCAELELNGQVFKVLVDTGSADLWVAGTVPNSIDTGLQGEVTYAVGNVKGPIKTADLRLGTTYSVPNQTFMLIEPDAEHPEGSGILGLGPSVGSYLTDSLPSPAGSPMLYRLFLQNRTAPNYFTILLGRDRDPTDHFPGSITISEILPEYSKILEEPRLEIIRLPEHREDDQHLQILLDADGLIGPDNQPIRTTSSVPSSTDKTRLTVVLDSGFSLPQISKAVAEAIYGRFHGAEYVSVSGIGSTYILPCDSEVNVTFKFGGKSFPIHPLDMTMDPGALGLGSVRNSKGDLACVGTFQPFTYDRASDPTYDMVLGMAFLRNVYTLFDYGDFLPQSSNSDAKDTPYIQLLSLTEPSEAHSDFVTARLGGVDVPPPGLLNDKSGAGGGSKTHVAAIAASIAVIGVLFIVGGIFVIKARRKKIWIR
ncbi:hypothetical protein D9611_010985 [Ephemerocybe angulata]|uniref:Peptidase A1 domain-containing protein n=1 Tax=Ephemerocybe angulata TaxID=980116 RepID=A0A8H5BD25_9AGAR|nr:hypothetical protein D9611_010985 [Tulosesus angulatus]